ncbi:MAG TPA: MFS transporter [Propionicimonas sp.]|nr:MFS transporter [Propionicimonas sp.]
MPRLAVSASRRWWTLATVSLTQLLIVLDGTIVNVALPSAQADLGFSDASRQWVVTAYALAFGSLLLLGGRVADLWGRKRTFLVGLVLFGAGSAWGGLTHSGAELLASRALQGSAAAFMAPAALAFVTLTFAEGPERNRAFAIFGSLAGLGSALGMLLGGVLTEFLSWRWCLLVNVPVALLGLVAGLILLPESRAEGDRRYDLWGALSATVGFAALVYGLTLAEFSWTAPATIGCVVLGVALIAAFVAIERRVSHPLLPLRILMHRTRAAAFTIQALVGVVGVGAMVYLAFHLQLVLHFPPLLAGLGTLPFTVSLMGTVPFALRMIDQFGPRRQLVFGPLISTAGMLLLSGISVDGNYWLDVLPGVALMGVGMGFTVVPLNNLALSGVDPHDAGVASATATATNQLGGSIGLAVLTAIYVAVAGGHASPSAMVAGYSAVFVVGAGVFAAAGLVAWLFIKQTPAAVAQPDRLPAGAAVQ